MKVMCINDEWFDGVTVNNYRCPKQNEIVTVVDDFSDCEGEWYKLLEYGESVFLQECFVPLSDLDETTFERNYDKVLL